MSAESEPSDLNDDSDDRLEFRKLSNRPSTRIEAIFWLLFGAFHAWFLYFFIEKHPIVPLVCGTCLAAATYAFLRALSRLWQPFEYVVVIDPLQLRWWKSASGGYVTLDKEIHTIESKRIRQIRIDKESFSVIVRTHDSGAHSIGEYLDFFDGSIELFSDFVRQRWPKVDLIRYP